MTSDTPIIPARMSVDGVKRLAAERNLDLHLAWRWSGRERYGILTVTKEHEVLVSESFARSTRMWGPGDERFDLVRTGSPKHRAVMKAVETLNDTPTSTERAAAREPLQATRADDGSPAGAMHIVLSRRSDARRNTPTTVEEKASRRGDAFDFCSESLYGFQMEHAQL